MKYSFTIAALAAASYVAAGPIVPKDGPHISDVQILNYALTLEHLENAFYHEGIFNYSKAAFNAAGLASNIFLDRGHFYENLLEISTDEQTHVNFLNKALGDKAVAPCTYSFPSTDPASFVALAAVLEGVGVSAYLGAAASIADKSYLTAAGSILTVEARHSAYLRSATKELPFPQPFDNPLDFNEVYSLAASFISYCPDSNQHKPQIKFRPFPPLTLGTPGTIRSGDIITLNTPGAALVRRAGSQTYAAFITASGPVFATATPIGGDTYLLTVPEGINGQSYVVLTCDQSVTDESISAGPAIIDITNIDTYAFFP